MTEAPLTRIMVISMRGSERRRSAFAQRAEGAGVPWQFFDAKEDILEHLDYDPDDCVLGCGRTMSKGELGCYSSHYAVWEQLIDDVAEQYVVLEDDALVDWGRIALLCSVDLEASGIQYLRLYYTRAGPFIIRKRKFLVRNAALLELISEANGTVGYAITRSAAKKLVAYCRQVVRPIDNQLDRFWEHGIPNLALFPPPVIEETGPSAIGLERFASTKSSLKRKFRILEDKLKRKAAVLRRKRHRQDWTLVWRREPAHADAPSPPAGGNGPSSPADPR